MYVNLLVNIHTRACESLKLSHFKIIEHTYHVAVFMPLSNKSRTRTLGEKVDSNTR